MNAVVKLPPPPSAVAPEPALEALPHGYTHRQIAEALSPLIQELILLPTEKCNVRCTYCYEDFELGMMSETTQTAIEAFLTERIPKLKILRLSWFGGEPLVAKDVVLRIAKHAKTLCDAHGVELTGGLTTNAYVLDKALAKQLMALHQSFYQITLDGWKEAHDALRKRADGKGTFEVIWQNLLGLRDLTEDFEVCVRIHVRRDNQENLETLMHEYAKAFYNDKRFRLDFQHLRDMGGEGGQTIINGVTLQELPVIEARLRKIVVAEIRSLRGEAPITQEIVPNSAAYANRQAARAAERIVEDAADSAVLDTTVVPLPQVAAPLPEPVIQTENNAQLEEGIIVQKAKNAGESAGSQRSNSEHAGAPYICYAAKANSLLIRSNGRIGKCTVHFDDERNDIGYLSDAGKIVIAQDKLRPWLRGLETLDTDITGCPIHGLPAVEQRSPFPNGKAFIAVKQVQ